VTATIAYDKPVRNLIDQLSATGHVTHQSYKKKSVTLHHNAGRLSHDGVLQVWKTRPASAHFDVDAKGAVAQYVKVNEYAWAAGSLKGNQESIHIENANATLSPDWTVADATWQSSARLAGWLHWKVIGTRPTKDTLLFHSHWSSTACAGPYMKKIYAKVLKAAQTAYDAFKKPPAKPSTPSSSGSSTPAKKSLDEVAKDVIQGEYGNGPERKRRLLSAGYDADKVQALVDEMLNPNRGRKSVKDVAAEVMAGKWGNNPQRAEKLRKAGYNPLAIQREVNILARAQRR
jgi:CW_7 repeat/N-acetylmuramoyl-L-alanine amidase